MPARAYNAAYPVHAAWSLEFFPTNVSVVFFQPTRDEHTCIASDSWPFEGLAECIAMARNYPWPIDEHIIPPEDPPKIWVEMFADKGLYRVQHAPFLPTQARIALTQRFLSRVVIDTVARPWAPAGNNAALIDSLNAYSVTETAQPDMFTTNIAPTVEVYLARAVEHYAAWVWANDKQDRSPLDWSDRERYRSRA